MIPDFSGTQNLIVYLFDWLIKEFDVRTIDSTTIPALLDLVYPIWNPVWKIVNEYLGKWFGF